MIYGCIAEKLSHSFSKEIHARLADYDYELCEIAPEALDDFMTKRDFKGINVTIPYKEKVIPYLDFIDDAAKEIGAVNTVINKDGRLCGYNTDFFGMRALIEKNGITISGKKVLILGSGGTSKTAAAVAKSLGASAVLRLSRTAREDAVTYEEATSLHADAEIIINTTPVGMYPNIGDEPINLDLFKSVEAVIDAVYNPIRTRLLQRAKARGLKTAGGLYMLVAQALAASEKFTESAIPLSVCDKVTNELLGEKENIVLTGMPGCGKTTVGRLLAERLGREFIDTDALIVEKAGASIPEIFEKSGEAAFRAIEAEVINEISVRQNAVIATGGGAVINPQNMENLAQNGRIYFINRPIELIAPTSDRPLSSNKADLEKRFNERYSYYISRSDRTVFADKTPEITAEDILKDFIKAKTTTVKIQPSKAVGTVLAPPSKSVAHRALICGALSGGSVIKNIELSDDIAVTVTALCKMGATAEVSESTVKIGSLDPTAIPDGTEIFCNESGSTLRFLMPLALISGSKITFTGARRLFERPLSVYEEICKEQNIFFEKKDNSVTVCGKLKCGDYKVRGDISSQFITGLIFALSLLDGDSTVTVTGKYESESYVDLTLMVLSSFGVCPKREQNTYYIRGNSDYSALEYETEGDCSNAAFLEAFNLLGGAVTVAGISDTTIQGDRVYKEMFRALKKGCKNFDLSDCPDLAPVMFAMAAVMGGASFSGTARLKMKESDRAEAMATELLKFGIECEISENSVRVKGGNLTPPTVPLSAHGDHRIAMSLALLCSLTGGEIEGAEVVSKSFPHFFETIKSLGIELM